jgi:eukaryotic-like serine/threonine-protein kinase
MWEELSELYCAALELPPAERAAFLDRACAGRPALRSEAQALLDAEARPASGMVEGLFEAAERVRPRTDGFADLEPATAAGSAGERPQMPERLTGFRLLRPLGHGGMGEVFLAEREVEGFRQAVAIKLLPAARRATESEARFLQERRILATLRHPGIAALIDGGTSDDGRPYLVLEYVDGTPLPEHCDRHRLTIDERLALFATVCDAVQYAHSHLVVHRDIKPSNLLVTAEGAVKLLDFGIAKLLEATGDQDPTLLLTHAEARLFTPLRAAPEQLLGEPVSTATDVYALGLLLFELTTGRLPFRGPSRDRWEAEKAVREGDLLSPAAAFERAADDAEATAQDVASARGTHRRALRQALGGDLASVLGKALERDPDRRYLSAGAFGEDIRRLRQRLPVEAKSATFLYRAVTFLRRHQLAAVLSATLAIALSASAALTWTANRRLERERNAARLGQLKADAALGALLRIFGEVDPKAGGRDETISVDELLARAESESRRLEVDELSARLLGTLGKLQRARGRFAEAERSFAEGWRRAAAAGADAETLDELALERARTLVELDRFDEARSAFRRLIEERRSRPGDADATDRTTLDVESELAELLPPTEGAERLRELLEKRRATATFTAIDHATALNRLGVALYRASARTAARETYETALALLDETAPADDSLRLEILSNLSFVVDDPRVGEDVQRRKIEVSTRHSGRSVATATAWNNLAVSLAFQSRFDEAEVAARRAWEIFLERLGTRHRETANTLRNIGRLQQLAGRYAEAWETLRQAQVVFHEADMARGRPFVDSQAARLGWLVERDPRWIEAMVEAAEAIVATSTSAEDRYPPDALLLAGLSQLEAGQPCSAVETLRRALDWRRKNGDFEEGRGLETRCALSLSEERCEAGAAGAAGAKSAKGEAASSGSARPLGSAQDPCAAAPFWPLADPELVARARHRMGRGPAPPLAPRATD